jgi:PPP family 3-phenylpropionic acid transporter
MRAAFWPPVRQSEFMPNLPYWRLSGFYFFYFAFVGAMSPFWGLYLKSLAFNAFQIGVLMSLLQVMRIFAPNIWGHIADRTGRRTAIVQLAALGSVLVFAGVFVSDGFWWLFAVMAALSFFWSASLPLVEAMTLSHLGERTDTYGRIRLWGSIGFILMVVGLGHAFDHVSIAWLPWAVLAVMLGIVAFARVIPESEILPHHTDHHSVWDVVKRPEVASLLAACLLMQVTHGPYYTFYSIYLVDHGYDKSTVGWLWALGVLCEIGIFLIIPHIFARVTPRRLILASFALAVLRFLLIAWGVESAWLVWGAQTLHAFSFGTYHADPSPFSGAPPGARSGALHQPVLRRGGYHRRAGQRHDLGQPRSGVDVYPGCRERGAGVGRVCHMGENKIRACTRQAMK